MNSTSPIKFSLIINRSLNFKDFPHCPQNPWMGACRWSTTSTSSPGEALGYVMGDLVEISEGSLKLTYYNGDKCKRGKRPGVVIVEFQCEKSGGTVCDVDTHTYAPMLTYMHTHTCKHTFTYAGVHIGYTFTHAHTHTHTGSTSPPLC